MKNNGKYIEPILRVENLVVSYFKREILNYASLKVLPGEIVALIGANGSGKSTLLKTIAGILKPSMGNIIFEGNDITTMAPELIHNNGIGFLIQGGAVFPSLTVNENLKLATTHSNKKANNCSIAETLGYFPTLNNMMSKLVGFLSGGERQLLAVAMLFVQNKNFWLCDEPSSGLSPLNIKEVMNRIRNISKVKGISILLVEQNLEEALRIADRVYLLKNKQAYLEEKPNGILNSGKLEKLFF